MKSTMLLAAALAGAMLLAGPSAAAQAPSTWDGLVQVKSKKLDLVYLQPGADFRGYTKVMLDPTEVAFRKNWRRDYNATTSGISGRISEEELQEAMSAGVRAASDIFVSEWSKAGYQIVSAPGADVLRVTTGVMNIAVSAPDQPTAARSFAFAEEAGTATLFVEARDSLTGAILGRAIDQGIAGDRTAGRRTRSGNRADFRDLVQAWATTSVRGMSELKAMSPIRQ